MSDKPEPVLIVEDDGDMARVLSEACEELGYTPVLVGSSAEALEAAATRRFPLAILDRLLPDGDSIDAIAELRRLGNVQAILMVSALAHAGHRSHGLDRGADDYLAKPFAPEELRARIRALIRRSKSQVTDNDFLVFGDLEIRVRARTLHFGQTHIALSPKEFELLLYFATHAGAPLSRMQLLEHVWNLHFDPQTNVVDVHVGRLRRKLESQTGQAWIHTARGAGYWFGPDAGGAE
ncbi:response regulator transcription factor [Rhodobacteraceae bacterium LMO-12]|nr:response regulator transcription factor [Rhodobacteraceae bacterium LMO-JJ12]